MILERRMRELRRVAKATLLSIVSKAQVETGGAILMTACSQMNVIDTLFTVSVLAR